jgi:hypothetical protein
MTNQTPVGDASKVVKNSSNTVQKPISIRTLVGSVLVLLAAAGIGMIIREFRFRSAGEKPLVQAPKAVQTPDIQETRQTPKEPEIQNIQEQLPIEEVFVEPEPLVPEPVGPPPIPTVDIGGQSSTGARAETAEVPQYQDPRLNDPVFKEQLGRYVLSFVGNDPSADEIWAVLINDPSLSGQVRQDLIEDLNENGFSGGNGRVATVDDLLLILYRIQLIELHAPDAMDEVNADAFDEAYKDLVNMAVRLTQQ